MRQGDLEPVVRDVDATVDVIICEAQLASGRDPSQRPKGLEVLLVDAVRCRSWRVSDGLRARGIRVLEVFDESELLRALSREPADVLVVESDTVRRFHQTTFIQVCRRTPVLLIAWTPKHEVHISPLLIAKEGRGDVGLDVDDLISQLCRYESSRWHPLIRNERR